MEDLRCRAWGIEVVEETRARLALSVTAEPPGVVAAGSGGTWSPLGTVFLSGSVTLSGSLNFFEPQLPCV